MWTNLNDFYKSKEWAKFRHLLINERLNENGETIDEVTGKPIVKNYDIILHHIIELTLQNVNDYNISLNPKNIKIVSFKTHNEIHSRFTGSKKQNVYLVVGSPCSGKTTWVKEQMSKTDILLDMDMLWQAITINEKYDKPKAIAPIIFALRDCILEQIKMRNGKFTTAYVLTTETNPLTRKRMCESLGAKEIYINATKEECLSRLEMDNERIDKESHKKYIERFFEDFIEDIKGE